jgi:osmotically-inducible protein OsmY
MCCNSDRNAPKPSGVRSQKNEVPMNDPQLTIDVEGELMWNPGLDVRLTVSVKDGTVMRSGTAATYFEETRAVPTAELVHGVKVVADDIEVLLRELHRKIDSNVANSIAHNLEWNSEPAGYPIQARVSDGDVTLVGEVPWNDLREDAVSVVKRVLGVRAIIDEITAKPTVVTNEIEKKIAVALGRNAALDARHIGVRALGEKVVLNGRVHSVSDRIVKRAAWRADGVRDVDDLLVVQPRA